MGLEGLVHSSLQDCNASGYHMGWGNGVENGLSVCIGVLGRTAVEV